MNVLGLMCSHRRDGNTNDLLDAVLNRVAESPDVNVVKETLLDYKIGYVYDCKACSKEGSCVNDGDDMQHVMNRVYEADVVVFGSPVYFYTVSTCLKVFLDRMSCYYYWKADELGGVDKLYGNFREKLAGRGGAVVSVQEETGYDRAQHCIGCMEFNFGFFGWENLGYALGPGGSRGNALKDADAMKQAADLADKIIAFKRQPAA
jgi:multimeric flavodoxin WrbA